jgi:hypothetical protein
MARCPAQEAPLHAWKGPHRVPAEEVAWSPWAPAPQSGSLHRLSWARAAYAKGARLDGGGGGARRGQDHHISPCLHLLSMHAVTTDSLSLHAPSTSHSTVTSQSDQQVFKGLTGANTARQQSRALLCKR